MMPKYSGSRTSKLEVGHDAAHATENVVRQYKNGS